MKDSTETRKKKKYGDFETLADSLGIKYEAAKKRYYRGDAEAVEIINKLIAARLNIIAQAQESNN